jgi:hypothetical protein
LVDVCGNDAPVTLRAWCMEMDGEPVAVAGYFPAGANVMVFSDIRRDDIPKIALWRAAKVLMAKIKHPAVCVTAESQAFLERLGWVYSHTKEDGDVYLWQT